MCKVKIYKFLELSTIERNFYKIYRCHLLNSPILYDNIGIINRRNLTMKDSCTMCNVIEQIKKGENPWFVKEMETGYAILGWNQHFYGYTLFICKRHVSELFELDKDYLTKFTWEMSIIAKAVKIAFDAEKINYECLGNGDIHLHWHIFPRKCGDLLNYGNDGKGPVWWLPKEIMWDPANKPPMDKLELMKNKLLEAINKELTIN